MPPPAPLTVSRPELLPDGSDAAFRRLIQDIITYSGRIQDLRNRFGALMGLTGSQYTILIAIAHLEGDAGVGVNAVAEQLHLAGAFVTSETHKLVALGLVEKRGDAADRRRVRLTVTPGGRERLAELTRIQAPVNDALFSSLTAQEFSVLRELLGRLVQHSGEALSLLDFYAARAAPKGG